MADILLESINPFGNLQAIVEADERVVYFYLHGGRDSDFGTRSVWVRNLLSAPSELDINGMKEGIPPLQIRAQTVQPQGGPRPAPEALRIEWLPEGNGAALYEGDEVLAIIPPWAGYKGFPGYARDAIGEGLLAWELRSDNVLFERFEEAGRYWAMWDDPELWGRTQEQFVTLAESIFGPHTNYYAIDGGHWPPKAILRFTQRDRTVLMTIGLSLLPQPNVDMNTDRAESLRRIEIGTILPPTWSDGAVKQFASYLSAQSGLPWNNFTWLGPSHTIPCDSWQNPQFTAAVLVDKHPDGPKVDLGFQFDDPITMLWFLPITEPERTLAMESGSDAMLQQLPTGRWVQA